jgi:hypothetical protein
MSSHLHDCRLRYRCSMPCKSQRRLCILFGHALISVNCGYYLYVRDRGCTVYSMATYCEWPTCNRTRKARFGASYGYFYGHYSHTSCNLDRLINAERNVGEQEVNLFREELNKTSWTTWPLRHRGLARGFCASGKVMFRSTSNHASIYFVIMVLPSLGSGFWLDNNANDSNYGNGTLSYATKV